MEVSFVDKFEESNTKPTKKLVVVAEEVPNLAAAEHDICFHDQLDGFNMKIAHHRIVDDGIANYEDLHMDEDLHMVANMDLNSLVSTEMIEHLVDIDVAIDVELDIVDVVEDLHDSMDLYVLDLPLVDMA